MAKVKFIHRLQGLFFFSLIAFIIFSLTLRAQAQEKLRVEGNLAVRSSNSGPPRYGLVLQPQASAPLSPQEGQLYYNSGVDSVYYYDGSEWKLLGSNNKDTYVAGIIVAASDTWDGVNRADQGYVCDGTADQVEIQAAIDALAATGGAVYLLEGTYNISSSINLNNTAPDDSGKSIIGTGKGTVLKIASGASNVSVINASNVSKIFISQLMIDGNGKTGSANNGIYFNAVTYSQIDRVWVENVKAYGIYLSASSYNIISDNHIQSNGSYGIFFSSSPSYNAISDNQLRLNDSGIYFSAGSNNNSICGNNIQGNTNYGIYATEVSNNVISHNNIQGNASGSAVYISQCSDNRISGNNLQSNRYGISLNASLRNIISGNNIQNNAYHGIFLNSGCSYNLITANVIDDNGGTGSYDGIRLEGNASVNVVSANHISDSAGEGYGINLATTLEGDLNKPTFNMIEGAGYSGRLIQDLGEHNYYTDKLKITLDAGWSSVDEDELIDLGYSPVSYVQLEASESVSASGISDGLAAGDLLVLSGSTGSSSISIPRGSAYNTVLGAWQRVLGEGDVLTLIWNGNDWVEIAYSNN